MDRMNREQFFATLAPLGEEQLKRALWNLYWRGTATVRQRIEGELEPAQAKQRSEARASAIDPDAVLDDVLEFVSLARSGAYLGGDRRVSPKERTKWRYTFMRHVASARDALKDEDVVPGAAAMEELIDLACEVRGYDYFRSEDPVEAAKLVVSDEVARLWSRVLDHSGFATFAAQAAPQLIRWESRYGWTRSGYGQVSQREASLASVLASMLRFPDAWITFADRYLDALDAAASADAAKPKQVWASKDWDQRQRTENLAEWHLLLLAPLVEYEADGRLDRLVAHRALAGPELTFLKARLAHQRGDLTAARSLVHDGLTELPGHQEFLEFAAEIEAPLPPRAQQAMQQRSSLNAMLASTQ